MRIRSRAVIAMAAAITLVLLPAGAGWRDPDRDHVRHYRTQPQVYCGLPPYDYFPANPAGQVRAISYRAVLIRTPDMTRTVPLTGATSHAYYQLETARLGVDQCSISRVAFIIWDNGYWSLSFDADQNRLGPSQVTEILPGASVPSRAPLVLPGSSAPTKFTTYIKRNQFTVKVRGLGAYQVPGNPEITPGHPVLFEIAPAPFWVQNGITYSPTFQGTNPTVASFFSLVDRVEIELSYR